MIRNILLAVLTCTIFASVPAIARAAQSESEQTAQQPKDADTGTAVPAATDTDAVATPTTPPIRAMDGAGPLRPGRVSPLQLGPVYMQSADYLQSADAII